MSAPTVLTVIPARGGSKGVPGKNLRLVAGKPLVAYSVEAALAARGAGQVLVSSDSPEILKAAGISARVGLLRRPAELAQDETPILPVYRHAVQEFEASSGKTVDYMIGLEPTTPFRLPADIDGCLEKALADGADVLVSVKAASENPYFVLVEPRRDDPRWFEQSKKSSAARRQDAPPVYTINGAVYVFTRKALFELENLYQAARLGVYEMPRERSIDLDEESDFEFAEFLAARRASGGG
ncbi:MAG: acylneuraminate cytidylyltransferase family protein [Elusimicrobiota bacterium]